MCYEPSRSRFTSRWLPSMRTGWPRSLTRSGTLVPALPRLSNIPHRGFRQMPRQPSLVDKHVGARLRSARLEAGKSQTEVAEALGVTFQQVQKYEKGANRISAGRLYELSRLLDVPVQSFFDGLGR